MKRTGTPFFVNIVCLLFALVPAAPLSADICPRYPLDASSTISFGNQDNCGDTTWDLAAIYGGYEWDEIDYDATGTCTGGYIDCDCNNHPLGYDSPTKGFSSYPGPYTDYMWWWVVTNYLQPELHSCDSGDCQSNGYSGETLYTWVDENAGWDEEPFQPCGD